MECPYYEICLPLPTSVNAMHTVGNRVRNKRTGKWGEIIRRSNEYEEWETRAGVAFRNAFPAGVQKLTGRLSVVYIFIWNKTDPSHLSSDIANREKCLSDFLEGKFFENDKAIDEQHQYRRVTEIGQNRALCRVYAIPDRRYDDYNLIFNPNEKD